MSLSSSTPVDAPPQTEPSYLFTTPSKIKRTHDVRQLVGIGKAHPNRRTLKRSVSVLTTAPPGGQSHRQRFLVAADSLDAALPGLAWIVDLLRDRGAGDGATATAVKWWVANAKEILTYFAIAKNLGLPDDEIALGIWQQYGDSLGLRQVERATLPEL